MTVDPALATVILALGASLAWGFGDFGGGLSSRRSPVFGVVLVVQAGGAALMLALALLRRDPPPAIGTVEIAIACGVIGAGAILALYHALAVGRMGVVAPVAAVLGASIPVLVGFVLLGPPSGSVMVGIVLGVVAVVLVSRVPAPGGRRSGIEWAILAGVLIGIFNVLVSRFPGGEVVWPLAIVRLTATLVVALVALVGRRPWRVPRVALPLAAAVAVADVMGNALYIAATHTGRLDVAAVVSSLFPVITVVLAILVLRERMTRSHAVGIAAAAGAVALIVAG